VWAGDGCVNAGDSAENDEGETPGVDGVPRRCYRT